MSAYVTVPIRDIIPNNLSIVLNFEMKRERRRSRETLCQGNFKQQRLILERPVSFPHPVHDVQLTAESLDGAANLQQLQSQRVVYGQAGRHPVGEV